MSTKSIELSEELYSKLEKMKPENETWEEFLSKVVSSKHPTPASDEDWEAASEEIISKYSDIFLKLAK
ncbi:MAG: hypothetical protein INQ03_00875 [Candidatus Heimdallarchaeota archaeon]|nr:hypothetical protein [Candidatus Heimdallarchaeota archaeon]